MQQKLKEADRSDASLVATTRNTHKQPDRSNERIVELSSPFTPNTARSLD